MNLCGENITDQGMLEKIFSTFSASSKLLQKYREMEFKKYSKLVAHLLVAEQHNEFLMRNHESRLPSTTRFPEVNVEHFHKSGVKETMTPVVAMVVFVIVVW